MRDLNDRIDPGLGWTLSPATAITASAQIVGRGFNAAFSEHASC
jgi:hypothetical protein